MPGMPVADPGDSPKDSAILRRITLFAGSSKEAERISSRAIPGIPSRMLGMRAGWSWGFFRAISDPHRDSEDSLPEWKRMLDALYDAKDSSQGFLGFFLR